ncbi:DNA repair exonuclease, partial [Candidatus Bathyarchaeota archaeon]|nr:DNA repair exonuclease [Candidatus Bathyarchaeota archaeon]
MRIAHVSDTHLGIRQYNMDERENDVYDAFNEIVEKVLEEHVDVLIHSGDLFDSPNPPIKALKNFKENLEKLQGRVKFITVLGDHDFPKRRGLPPHSLFEEVKVLGIGGLESIEVDGVLIAGISNLRGRSIELLKTELQKFDQVASKYSKSILVVHQGVDRYLPFEGAYELREADLPKKASYYAFGHIHSRALAKFGRGCFAYAGSTEVMRRDEVKSWTRDGRGFYIADLDGDGIKVHKIDVDIRPQYEVEVDLTKEDLQAPLLKHLNLTRGKTPILHIYVSGRNMDTRLILNNLNVLLKDKTLKYNVFFKDLTTVQKTSML